MCEIFPEVKSCCIIADLRLGMLFIAVFAIMTGALGMTLIEKATNASYNSLKNVTNIDQPKKIISGLRTIIPAGITACSAGFIVSGLFLLLGNLGSEEGFIQVFVWLTFLVVLVGYMLIIMVAFECMLLKGCLIGGIDWLSSAALLVFTFFYLCVWIYFIIVANSSIFTM